MSTLSEKAIENAVKLASWVHNYIEVLKKEKAKDVEKYGSSLRTRARSFLELLESSGFLPTFTFFYAKATEDVYRKVCQLLEEGKIEPVEVEEEKFGYAVFLHGISLFLEQLGLIADHKCPRKTIEELKEGNRITLARNLLLPYVLELKKLSEALFKGG